MSIQITTNNVPRPVLTSIQVPRTHWGQLDIDPDDWEDNRSFVKYKGEYIDLDDFQTTKRGPWNHGLPEEFGNWDAYMSDTYFSGLLIRMVDDFENAILAHYFTS